jgi:hypothetical protein
MAQNHNDFLKPLPGSSEEIHVAVSAAYSCSCVDLDFSRISNGFSNINWLAHSLQCKTRQILCLNALPTGEEQILRLMFTIKPFLAPFVIREELPRSRNPVGLIFKGRDQPFFIFLYHFEGGPRDSTFGFQVSKDGRLLALYIHL